MRVPCRCYIGIVFAAAVQTTLSACTTATVSVIGGPNVNLPPTELDQIFSDPRIVECFDEKDTTCRNSYIAYYMYRADENYYNFEAWLSRGDAVGSFGVDLTQIGLAAAAGVIPVTQTTKLLSAASAAVGLGNTAFNKDILYAQTIQVIEQQMNTQRASVKQTILARMVCPAARYPLGFFASDLQAYENAGTVTSALNGIAKSTANAQPVTNESGGTATPATTSTTPGAHTFTTKNGGTVTLSYKANPTQSCPVPAPPATTKVAQPAPTKSPVPAKKKTA